MGKRFVDLYHSMFHVIQPPMVYFLFQKVGYHVFFLVQWNKLKGVAQIGGK